MSKPTNYERCKIDVANISVTPRHIYCECFTPLVPLQIESRCFARQVTMDELKGHVADGKGIVWMTYDGEPEESHGVSFEDWFEGMECKTRELMELCAEVINKREGRTAKYDIETANQRQASLAVFTDYDKKRIAYDDYLFPIIAKVAKQTNILVHRSNSLTIVEPITDVA